MALYHSWRQILLPPACVPRPGHALLADSSLSGETLALPGWTQSRLPVPAPSAQGLCCDCCCWVRSPTAGPGLSVSAALQSCQPYGLMPQHPQPLLPSQKLWGHRQ
ncbi:hypothetical protein AAFF_G00373310 [Aldrovandia affinis]|uniref:Uncharacterized protein n=1 Tax=Aldrovandia affinis TaxID=143900 RepID=A0AAD7SII4_9TELE|nr:hypothetical protein AAFF_G00373310 [Aldrovandia affinis]